jgi:predicted nucleotidyltransferase
MTELALLAEKVGTNERTLRRAVNEGTLRASRPTPRTLQLSLSERRYIRRSWATISALRAALRTDRHVRFALLFGSAARGTDTLASDIDVLVQMSDPSLERIVDVEAKLSASTGRRIEVVRLEDAEREPSFLADLIAEGRVIVDRDELWEPLRRRQSTLSNRGRRQDAHSAQAALAGIDHLLSTD